MNTGYRWIAVLFLFILSGAVVLATATTDGSDQIVVAEGSGSESSTDGTDTVWSSVGPSESMTDGSDSVHIIPPLSVHSTSSGGGGGGGALSPEDFCAANNGTLRIVSGDIVCVTPNGNIKPPESVTFITRLSRLFDKAIGQPLVFLVTVGVIWFIVYKRRQKKEEERRRREREEQGR